MGFSKGKKDIEDAEEINIFKEILGMVVYVLSIVILIYLILHYVGQRTEVNGQSMENTLYNNDSLWIDKLSYRFKDPERFDIIVFPVDSVQSIEEGVDTYYIKRIIGLPGETVYISNDGEIYIDGSLLEEDYGKETISPYRVGIASEIITLGEDEYFVMGDNRNNSQDSRVEQVGNIKDADIVGKAVFRIWPLNRFGSID